ncbi:MAG: sigma factor-like helix-turn-helix DNA-binding protein [Actinomycetota bacterium]
MIERGTASEAATTTAERLYVEDGVRLERSILGAFGDPEVAGEAVAEAFAQLLRRGDEVRDPRAWVWRSAFAIARGLRSGPKPAHMVPDTAVEQPQWPFDLLAALDGLSPLQREAVVLHHYAGWPLREVAVLTGSTVGALKVHLSRGRRRLREQLGEEAIR